MVKNADNKKVISKGIKGKKKILYKKDNIFIKIINILKYHRKICVVVGSLLMILLVSIIFISNFSINHKVITINNNEYYESDFMMYFYSAKYNFFGNSDVTEDDLNALYDSESNMTVSDYLKNMALNDLKTSSAILKMAYDNNIILDEKDYEELSKEKQEFINSIGSVKKFKKFLSVNNTTDDAYNNMAQTDKLYKKILKKLYYEGKVNDLNSEEYEEAKNSYKYNYFKIKQIILTTIDINSGKNLSSTMINQKEALANSIVNESKSGVDFDTLIQKYSEDAIDKEPPYETYYKKGELLSDLEKVLENLKPGEISKPIKTKYAYHIIQKIELDDSKLNDYYDDLREEKCINDLKEYIDNLKIVYHEAYEKIEVK